MGIFYALKQRTFFKDPQACSNAFWSHAVIMLIAIAIVFTNINNHLWKRDGKVVQHDVIGYYGYLPAAFIYKDLTFRFVLDHQETLAHKIYVLETPNGGTYQKMTMGLSFLYLPFFLGGHLHASIIDAPLTGYSWPYMMWLLFSSGFYLILGLLLLRSVLRRYFSDGLTAFVIVSVVVGTNLFYYATLEGPMSHSYNFFLFALFIWLSIRWYENPGAWNSIAVGLTYGLIGLIRPTNGLIVLFFLLFNITRSSQVFSRIKLYLEKWHQILLIILAAFIVILPQLLFWKMNTGSWVYYSYGEEGFFFSRPQIIRGLFSYRKGWLLYTPIMTIALVGIWTLRKRLPAFFLSILLFTLLNIYIIYSWWDFSYGGSFGSRPVIDSYPFMAISMAAMVDVMSRRKKIYAWLLKGLMVLLIFFNVFQTLQYKYSAIHFSEMSKAAYWYNFGKLSADETFFDLLEPMDYGLLLKGEYGTETRLDYWIKNEAVNDFEVFSRDSLFFTSSNKKHRFINGNTASNMDARSGTQSATLTPENAFGSAIDFFVDHGHHYSLSVWIKPANEDTYLVISSIHDATFYEVANKIDTIDNQGWGRLQFQVEIPEIQSNAFRVYVWNQSADTIYIDDLHIKRLK